MFKDTLQAIKDAEDLSEQKINGIRIEIKNKFRELKSTHEDEMSQVYAQLNLIKEDIRKKHVQDAEIEIKSIRRRKQDIFSKLDKLLSAKKNMIVKSIVDNILKEY